MEQHQILFQTIIFLTAAVVAVPLSKKLGIGSVVGYLAAGIIIGPWVLGLIDSVENVMHLSELGVVLLLFLIGLELKPSRLWVMRYEIFGLGALQVLLTGFVLAGITMLFKQSVSASIIIGFGLALSSTAFAIQVLSEKGQLNTLGGRKAFAILLFQDLAVVPLLAMISIMGVSATDTQESGLMQGLIAVGVVLGVVLTGRFLLNPLFRFVTYAKSNEVFTAAALLVVLGTAYLVNLSGLSMALGAFLAGLMLAESEYRHQIMVELEPFRGLLMGLFFLAIGMTVNLGVFADAWFSIILLALGFMAIKGLIMLVLVRIFKGTTDHALTVSAVLAQGGEFAFVIFGQAVIFKIIDAQISATLIMAVTVSMALTPLVMVTKRLVKEKLVKNKPLEFTNEVPVDEYPAIIIGFGRVGQIVGKVLATHQVNYLAVDFHPDQIRLSAQHGHKIYFGDPKRAELLKSAGIDQAKLVVITEADPEESMKILETIMRFFPHVKIIVRARNRQHVCKLLEYDVEFFTRETFESSLLMGDKALQLLGTSKEEAKKVIRDFRAQDEHELHEPIRALRQDEVEKLS